MKTAEAAIQAVRGANARGIAAILNFLGEYAADADDARRAADEYIRLIDLIHEHKAKASISLKASQVGLLVSREECLQNIRRVAAEAARLDVFIWLDMEGSALTQKTLDIFDPMRQEFPSLGVCLQSNLVRTGGDLDRLMRLPRQPGAFLYVRLCKGAYREPPSISYTGKPAVDGNYRMLLQKIFEQTAKGVRPALATHDHALIDFILALVAEKKVPSEQFEFQMLYGVETERLSALAQRGFRASVYISYGTIRWAGLLRRLRERKKSLYFMARNVFSSIKV